LFHAEQAKAELRATMKRELETLGDVAVVLLGRPYACLAPQLNKGIPDIIASLGVKVFFQDMLSYEAADVEPVAELGRAVHWHYAAAILEAAEVVGKTPGLYPVIVTCFKCTPDSCTLDYAKRILDSHDKPYLVLELDEHDSALGYETRIEAAVRAFRNHHGSAGPRSAARPRPRAASAMTRAELRDRTLFVPTWDELTCELVVANLNRWGVRAERLVDDPQVIQKSQRLNAGQCIPLTIIAQSFIDALEQRQMDPADAAVWVPRSQMACNLGMFPAVLGSLFEAHGHGFERAQIYAGGIAMVDLSPVGALDNYLAHMTAGYLRRMACHVRPYERTPGLTDAVLGEGLGLLRQAFRGERPKLEAVTEVVERFLAIELERVARPKVATFGDLYTRDNDVANQDLVRFIEAHGGEVVTTPYSEYAKIIAASYFGKWMREGNVGEAVASSTLLGVARVVERPFLRQFERVLGPSPRPQPPPPVEAQLAPFAVSSRHTGESFDNLLKILQVLREYPDVSLFVQANPAYCCPSLVTEAMSRRIEEVTGVPVVTLTYDGTACSKNEAVIPYLTWPRTPRALRRGRHAV
jgi:predicted nucleotide-binding protein (sugar kinase/HSP70/actin superfamily)